MAKLPCGQTSYGSARCRARWSESSGKVYPGAGFVLQARAAGAHTVELNLKPSDGAELFLERIEGPAREIVPAYIDMLLSG